MCIRDSNNTDPAEGQASLTAWTEKGFDDTIWKTASGKFGAKRGALTSFDGFTPVSYTHLCMV